MDTIIQSDTTINPSYNLFDKFFSWKKEKIINRKDFLIRLLSWVMWLYIFGKLVISLLNKVPWLFPWFDRFSSILFVPALYVSIILYKKRINAIEWMQKIIIFFIIINSFLLIITNGHITIYWGFELIITSLVLPFWFLSPLLMINGKNISDISKTLFSWKEVLNRKEFILRFLLLSPLLVIPLSKIFFLFPSSNLLVQEWFICYIFIILFKKRINDIGRLPKWVHIYWVVASILWAILGWLFFWYSIKILVILSIIALLWTYWLLIIIILISANWKQEWDIQTNISPIYKIVAGILWVLTWVWLLFLVSFVVAWLSHV